METGATGELVRHRQTKGAATDMFGLKATRATLRLYRKQKFKTLPTFRRREGSSVAPRNRQLGQQGRVAESLEYFFRHYWQ